MSSQNKCLLPIQKPLFYVFKQNPFVSSTVSKPLSLTEILMGLISQLPIMLILFEINNITFIQVYLNVIKFHLKLVWTLEV